MREAIDAVLDRDGGVATRARLLTAVTESEVDDEIRRQRLTRVFRRTYCRPWDAELVDVRERAAIASVGLPAALSHLTALRRRTLLEPPPDPDCDVHVSIPAKRLSRPQPGLVVHRVSRPPRARWVDGSPTTSVANAVVTSWPLLPARDRRGPAITAVRRGLVGPVDLAGELARHPRLGGRQDLCDLVDLLAAGCESELEIWGLTSVFDVPGLRHGVRQRRVRAGSSIYRLDLAYDEEKVAVELDGDRFHSTPRSRDLDRRRDAALAAIGWLTLRFSWFRLHDDVDGCRRDTLNTLAARRPLSGSECVRRR